MTVSDLQCPQCGSTYHLKVFKLMQRDVDSIDCSVCGKKDIFDWNEAKMYTATLVDKKEWPKKD